MFNTAQTIETWNGTATALVRAQDADLTIDLMGGRHWLQEEAGEVIILGKATDGMPFQRDVMVFATDETKHNYLVDFSA